MSTNDLGVKCPGCDVAITFENAGGYKTFCEDCVDAIPPLPKEGAYDIEGRYPNFYWIRVD